MKPEPDELELAIRARSGDREALVELIERVRLRLFALAYTELRHYEDAQDAVAAAIFHICRHVVDLREPDAMRAWMFTIVRNETHRLRRGKQMRSTSLDEVNSLGMEDPSPLLRLDVERALRQLPYDQARAIGLFYLSEWPIAAIAGHMARPEGTIKRWLHQGRQRLATEMKGYFPMDKVWKACIVASEITPGHLSGVTDALKAAGWADVKAITDVRSLNDLYHIEKSALQQLGPGCERPAPHLSNPLADCDCLYLGEQIAGRSAFEFMPIVRAIRARLPVCLLLEPLDPALSCNSLDTTVYASWLSGFDLCITLDKDASVFQHFFSKLREGMEANGYRPGWGNDTDTA